MSYGKVVSKGRSRLNAALHNSTGTVHVIGAILEQSMEMQRRGLVAEAVVGVDDDAVANGNIDHLRNATSVKSGKIAF